MSDVLEQLDYFARSRDVVLRELFIEAAAEIRSLRAALEAAEARVREGDKQ